MSRRFFLLVDLGQLSMTSAGTSSCEIQTRKRQARFFTNREGKKMSSLGKKVVLLYCVDFLIGSGISTCVLGQYYTVCVQLARLLVMCKCWQQQLFH